MLNRHAASTLPEYVDLALNICEENGGNIWFRGHSTARYQLTPSVLRNLVPHEDARGNLIEGGKTPIADGYSLTGISPERMLDNFKRKSRPFLKELPRNDFEWLFLMQHHGVPTRLLDWSTNALVALYFAVSKLDASKNSSNKNSKKSFLEKDELQPDGAAVYAISPEKLNEKSIGLSYPVDVAESGKKWAPYVRPMEHDGKAFLPIAVIAPHVSPRIKAQSGAFTLHGANVWALDYYTALRPIIHKIFIPYNDAIKIKDQLRFLGITASFIFPDLTGLAEEIHQLEMLEYSAERY